VVRPAAEPIARRARSIAATVPRARRAASIVAIAHPVPSRSPIGRLARATRVIVRRVPAHRAAVLRAVVAIVPLDRSTVMRLRPQLIGDI